MHHVTLDRTGANDGNLDDQIVIGARLQARQHRHLGPALDLEGAQRVGLADHRIGARILGRDAGEVILRALVRRHQGQPLGHAGQHAKRQHIDLHELQGVDVILVPFDDLAILHRGRLDRHQIIQPVMGQHEAARMLRQMPRCAHQLPRQIKGQPQTAVGGVQVQLGQLRIGDALVGPGPDQRGERGDQILGQAHRLADIAQRPLGAVADDGRGQRGMVAAIGLVNPLDHLFAALVFKVDVDIGRLAAFLADETLKQQVIAAGINGGDAQDIADRRVGRRAAPLAQDILRPGIADDAVHGQEIGRIVQPADQGQLMVQRLCHLGRDALGITRGSARPC